MSDSTPTAAFDPSLPPPEKRSKLWLWILLAVVAVIVVAAVAAVLIARGPAGIVSEASLTASASASATATAKATAKATKTPTMPADDTDTDTDDTDDTSDDHHDTLPPPEITSFSVEPNVVTCAVEAPGFESPTSFPLTISWTSTGGSEAFIGVDTSDAQLELYAGGLPPDSDTFDQLSYNCFDDHTYTVTIVGPDGQKASESITVVNNGDRPQ